MLKLVMKCQGTGALAFGRLDVDGGRLGGDETGDGHGVLSVGTTFSAY